MADMVLTRRLGEAIRRLQQGDRVNRVRRYHQNWFYWVNDQGCDIEDTSVFEQLIKLKFMDVYDFRREFLGRCVQRTNKAWKASKKCLDFKLPPEEFWVKE